MTASTDKQETTIERSLVGCMLVLQGPPPLTGDEAMALGVRMWSAVREDDFLDSRCRAYWRAIGECMEAHEPADPLLVASRLGLDDGGRDLLDCAHEAPSVWTGPWYADRVAEAGRARWVAMAAAQHAQDIADRRVTTEDGIANLRTLVAESGGPRDGVSVPGAIAGILDEIEHRGEGLNARAVTFGLPHYDQRHGGLRAGELCVLAARTSMGKSALAGQVAARAAEAGHPVIFFSLEMGHTALLERAIANMAQVEHWRLRIGGTSVRAADWNAIDETRRRLEKCRFVINDRARSLAQIQAESYSWIAQSRSVAATPLVVVDYLQLVAGTRRNDPREQQVAEVSRGLKAIAMEGQCPVLALAQLSRRSEQENRDPALSDLRESGAIEQDADVVLFVQRNRTEERGEARIIVAKNRDGRVGAFGVGWNGPYLRFDARDWREE